MRSQEEQRAFNKRGPPSDKSSRGLDWFSFFLADVQMGFGPFLSIYLTTQKWTGADIGFVLTAGSIVGLVGQLPGGALIDALRRDKLVACVAMFAIGISAFWIATSPQFVSVLLAQMLHIGASVVIGPALAAISLGLVGHMLLAERLGRNARYASCGSIAAAAIMGAVGDYISSQAVFFVTAAMTIPAIMALRAISSEEIRRHRVAGKARSNYAFFPALRQLLQIRLLLVLAACVFLFHLANAAVLPIVARTITMRSAEGATSLVALCVIVPQIMAALISPAIGRYADSHGRRLLLLGGFAALPLRVVLLAANSDPAILVAIQLLDGISASCLGVLVATCVADIVRGVNFNLALGLVGSAMGIGAAISTYLAGIVADHWGSSVALLLLSVVGLMAFLVCALFLPETSPRHCAPPEGRDERKQ